MVKEKLLSDSITALNKNITDNTMQMAKLEAEIKATRQVDVENREFLEKIIEKLMANQVAEQRNTWSLIKNVLDWALRIIMIVILTYLGIKTLSGVSI